MWVEKQRGWLRYMMSVLTLLIIISRKYLRIVSCRRIQLFEKCDINAYGGYNKGNQRAGNVKENDSNGLWKINRAVPC